MLTRLLNSTNSELNEIRGYCYRRGLLVCLYMYCIGSVDLSNGTA
jgi:hypothetical protein